MLQSVEAVQPGTLRFTVRGAAATADAPVSLSRVRVEVIPPRAQQPAEDAARGAPADRVFGGGGGGSAPVVDSSSSNHELRSAFRRTLVMAVNVHHEDFIRSRGGGGAPASTSASDGGGSGGAGAAALLPSPRGASSPSSGGPGRLPVEWDAQFNLEAVPPPPCAPLRVLSPHASGRDTTQRTTTSAGLTVPRGPGRTARCGVSDGEAAAARAELGSSGAVLPLGAVAAVMNRAVEVGDDTDPAVVAERARRRLAARLPELFDAVRSCFTTWRRRACALEELTEALEKTVRSGQGRGAEAPRDLVQGGLRLLASSAPEWCEIAVSPVSGEELFRVTSQDTTVARFVRQKVVAMKDDKL